jgi:tRNA nucleotidyltransferase (CCA-adding enzyme)
LNDRPRLPGTSVVPALAREVAAAGGRLLIVGGWVRDQILEIPCKDLDVEIFGLSIERISDLLEDFGSIGPVGRHFPVWRLRGQDLDISYPREAAEAFVAAKPDTLQSAYRTAARHRDFSLNTIAWDPLNDTWLDPWNGRADLEARMLRAVDAETFGSDPIRGLRAARLHAGLEFEVDAETAALCGRLDLDSVPVERIANELRRMLLEPRQPSRAFSFLDHCGGLEVFPLVAALRAVPQDPRWHPEGDVFVHTCMVVDRARSIGASLPEQDREILQWAALCHDLGKPSTTRLEGERVRSIGHERLGAKLWLSELRISHAIVSAVEMLVAHHLAPSQFVSQGAGPKAYRRLARKLASGSGVTLTDLERVARSDHLGRTTPDAIAGRYPEGERFLAAAAAEGVDAGVKPDVVSARDLMERGLAPGPSLGRALERARVIQDEHGWPEPDRIADAAIAEDDSD